MTNFVNPFDPQNFAEGGGLWDQKIVTVTESKFGIHRFNKSNGEEVVQNVWFVTGIADDEESERQQRYSIGGLHASSDGESFAKADGTPGTLHKNSAGAKFAAGLAEGGFDTGTLIVDNAIKASKLNGARIEFKAVQRKDKDGNLKVNKKGYPENDFYPAQFHGYADGTTPKAVDETVKKQAEAIVTELLNAAENNTLTQADIVRGVSKKLNGDPNSAAIVSLVVSESFKNDGPWSREGNNLTSIPF